MATGALRKNQKVWITAEDNMYSDRHNTVYEGKFVGSNAARRSHYVEIRGAVNEFPELSVFDNELEAYKTLNQLHIGDLRVTSKKIRDEIMTSVKQEIYEFHKDMEVVNGLVKWARNRWWNPFKENSNDPLENYD